MMTNRTFRHTAERRPNTAVFRSMCVFINNRRSKAIISGSGLPLPNLKAKFARIEGAGSFPGRLKARSFSFLTSS